MVAAAKAHRHAQQAGKQTPRQADANALLQSFEQKMQKGHVGEALRVATTAVDLFVKEGDRAGECRALSCVAQAMAYSEQRAEGVLLGTCAPSETGPARQKAASADGEAMPRNCLEEEDDGLAQGVAVAAEDASIAGTDLTQLPISYGERLILETCMRSRSRPYDRQRQEELAQPRNRGGTAASWGVRDGGSGDRTQSGGPAATASSSYRGTSQDQSFAYVARARQEALNTEQVDDLVNRLSQPKRAKQSARPPGEQIILRSQEKTKSKGDIDISSIVSRLATPRAVRALSPTPGERVLMMWNRSDGLRRPDLQRINELAKATRRGGCAKSWGVRPSTVFAEPSLPNSARGPAQFDMPAPRPPDSARGPRPRPAPGTTIKEDPGNNIAGGDFFDPEAGMELPRLEPVGGSRSPAMILQQELDDDFPFDPVTDAADLDIDLPDLDRDLPDTSQGNWNHPWRSGVDRYV